ncbi:helix-turn-helix domain-containing protein [Actinomadura fibrosa]|uniref:Helix-turn-helix domain-containing protein n=1 Tax=Actinomadura fibrosa TaxID=111802 RepID=A0ABW2XED7_9ACTN|nr:helix-turn-helix domain-containing protein [Actinomadura fibrosa]
MTNRDIDMLTSEALGARLRELREQSGRSLRALSRELGISPSAVSQIERGAMRPSVSRLIAYVTALGVPLAAVFETGHEKPVEGPQGIAVRRSWEVAPILLGGGVTFRRLSPIQTPGVEFFESIYPPGAESNAHGRLLRHVGYEVGTVTEGELTIEFEREVVTLSVDDSITFPCDRPHSISNRSAAPAVATWLIVHP